MKVENIKIQDLVPDDKNANKHTEQGDRVLEKSISRLGLGRSILLDMDNRIIAGNGVTEKCAQLGIDNVRIIETDGNEIIAVKRVDVSLDSKKGRELAIADNQAAKTGIDFDRQVLLELNEDYGADLAYFEVDTNSALANTYDMTQTEYEPEKVPYPITIVVNKADYERWCEIKDKLCEPNDKQAFFRLLQENEL